MDYELTPLELDRRERATDELIRRAAAENLTVRREDIVNLPSVRLAMLADEPLGDRAMNEVRALPGLAEQIRRNELKQRLEDSAGKEPLTLTNLTLEQRMTLGREMQRDQQAKAQPARMSAAEEATALVMLSKISSTSERLNTARRMGLI